MRDYQNGQWFDIYGWTEWIDRDTIMPNGKTYYNLKSDNGTGGLLRQEGTRVVGYSIVDSPFVFYDFSKTKYDTINRFIIPIDTIYSFIVDDRYVYVFGQLKRMQTYYQKGRLSTEGIKRYVADGFGVVQIMFEPGEEYYLRGTIINNVKYGTITSVANDEQSISATGYSLAQNYPNPFNSSTTFSFNIPKSELASLIIYDILGRETEMVISGYLASGSHKINWNSSKLVSGIYFYTLKTNTYSQTKKLLFIK